MRIAEAIIFALLSLEGWTMVTALDWTSFERKGCFSFQLDPVLPFLFAAAWFLIVRWVSRATRDRKCLARSLAYGWRTQVAFHWGKGVCAFVLLAAALSSLADYWSPETKQILFLVMCGIFLLCLPTCFFRSTPVQIGWLAGILAAGFVAALPFWSWGASRIAADLYGSMENPIETTRCFLLILDAVLLGLSFFTCYRIEAAGVRPKSTDCPDRTSGTAS